MAKQLRWQRAWECFAGEFTGDGPYHKGAWSSKRARRKQRMLNEMYWNLIGLLEELGIESWLHKDLGVSTYAQGGEFNVGGSWEAGGLRVNLICHSPSILAHEFTHAIDFLQRRGYSTLGESELVACAGGYLLVCHYGGVCSPSEDIDYAKRQGASVQTLEELDIYILELFHQMIELIEA